MKIEDFYRNCAEEPYELNRKLMLSDQNFKMFKKEIEYTKSFIKNLDYLNFNRSYCMDIRRRIFSIDIILISARQTLHSIQMCCENCNLADAHTLIRKYRDDLFFYLYILYVDADMDIFNNKKIKKHELNIERWNNNELNDLNISQILMAIGNSDTAKEAVKKYNLKKKFDDIGKELNNFVHSNGRCFYNKIYNHYSKSEIKDNLQKIQYKINYITSAFLFLLILIRQSAIASSDYIDCLEMGIEPEENSQYWVAPFVEEYINNKMVIIGDEVKEYLKSKVEMEI